MGHGRLAGNSPEIARAGKKITKSISREQMVVETGLTPQNGCKRGFSGVMGQIIPIQQPEVFPKMNYSDMWRPCMVKF